MFGRALTKVYRGYLFGKQSTEPYRGVRYDRNTLPNALVKAKYEVDTGTRHLVKFGMNSIPVLDTSVSSVRPQHRYPTLM